MWLQLDQSVIYFVTLCVKDRKHVLANPQIFAAIHQFCSKSPSWTTRAAVVMPNHMHALISPKRDRHERVPQFSAGLKRFVRPAAESSWQWQQGVFDRLLRSGETAQAKWMYLRENPVRAGLVTRWEDWPYLIGFSEDQTAA
jgi:REP element-mobilizing transposase RayT